MTKTCPHCAEEIQLAAHVCKHCGLDVTTGAPPAPSRAPASPGVAALLSFLIPGSGQIYAGEVGPGIAFFVLTAVGYLLFIVPGLLFHFMAIFAAYNAAKATT